MEYWNMHTYSNKTIDSEKISLLKNGDVYDANSILVSIIEKDVAYVKNNFEFLYEYYIYLQDLKTTKTFKKNQKRVF